MSKKKEKKTIGWREWVALPQLGIDKIKAKIDTGARSSSIHALHIRYTTEENRTFVHFEVKPQQKGSQTAIRCTCPVEEFRTVKSSNGHTEKRPVIVADIQLLGERWPIEITLTNRSEMGFRMLLGRESFRRKFLVDAGNSFYGLKAERKKEI